MGVLLAIDGNSLVHRSFHSHARTAMQTSDGRPCWAIRGLLMQLVAAVDRIRPDAVVLGFDDPDASERRDRWPQYKAQRTEKLDTLVDQLAAARDAVTELGLAVVVPPGLEADDVLASAARAGAAAGMQTVVVTSDRDAFALIDDTTRVLRIINGGVEASPLMSADRLELLAGVRPEQYRDFAALRGDPSDNLPGVRGIGPRSAARLLARFGSARAAFDAPDEVRAELGAGVAARLAAPEARAAWELNCQVMAMRDDVAVDPAAGTLPVPAQQVARVFGALNLTWTTRDALRVLADVGDAAAAEDADGMARQQRPEPLAETITDGRNWPPASPASRSRPKLPRLAPRAPEPAQLSLF